MNIADHNFSKTEHIQRSFASKNGNFQDASLHLHKALDATGDIGLWFATGWMALPVLELPLEHQ